MEQQSVDFTGLNRYCVVCGQEFGPYLDGHCTPDSLVLILKEGVFNQRTRFFSLDGKELSEEELIRIRDTETARMEEAKRQASPPAQPSESSAQNPLQTPQPLQNLPVSPAPVPQPPASSPRQPLNPPIPGVHLIPIRDSLWKLILGALIVFGATFIGSFFGPYGNSIFCNGSFLGCILGLLFTRWIVFGQSHLLEQTRWKRYWNGALIGYWISYMGLLILDDFRFASQPRSLESQSQAEILIYFVAVLISFGTGMLNLFLSDTKDQLEFLCNLHNSQALPLLIDFLKRPNAGYRRKAAMALGKTGDRRAVPMLLASLSDPDSDVRFASVDALGNIRDVRVLQPLIELLMGPDPYMALHAAQSLGNLGAVRALDPLIHTLKHSTHPWVRKAAADALGAIGDPRAQVTLSAALEDTHGETRKAAAEALKKLKNGPVPDIFMTDLPVPDVLPSQSPVEKVQAEEASQPAASTAEHPRQLPQPLPQQPTSLSGVNRPVYPGVAGHAQPKKQFNLLWVVGGIFLVMIAIVVGLAIWRFGSPHTLPVVSDRAITATVQPRLEGFQQYYGEGMAIMLPNTFFGGNPATEMDYFSRHLNRMGPDYAFALDLAQQNQNVSKFLAFDSEPGENGELITVFVSEKPESAPNETVPTILEGLANEIRRGCNDCVVGNYAPLTIHGYDGGWLEYTVIQEKSAIFLAYVIKVQDALWFVTFGAGEPSYRVHKPFFEQSIQTFTTEISTVAMKNPDPVLVAGPAPLPSPTPASTATPEPSPTPPAASYQRLPALAVINPSNANKISEQAGWGSGVPNQVRVSSDGNWMAVGTSNGVSLYGLSESDSNRYVALKRIDLHAPLLDLALSADGQTLALACADGRLELLTVPDGELLYRLKSNGEPVVSLALLPGENQLIGASTGGTVQVWSLANGQLVASHPLRVAGAASVALSPDGRILAAALPNGPVQLWEVSAGKLARTLAGHKTQVVSLAFSPDGQRLASGSQDGAVRTWRVSDGRSLLSLQGKPGWVKSLVFSPDGQTLAAAAYDTAYRLGDLCSDEGWLDFWKVTDGSLLGHWEGGDGISNEVNNLAFLPDNKTLAISFCTGEISLRSMEKASSSLWQALEENTRPASAGLSPDGTLLAISSQETKGSSVVDLWRIPDLILLRSLAITNPSWVQKIDFSADGQTLAVHYQDGPFLLWQISSGDPQITVAPSIIGGLTLAPDWQTFTVAGGGTVMLNRMPTNLFVRRLDTSPNTSSSAAYSPDSQTVAFGSKNGELELARLADEKAPLRKVPAGGQMNALLSLAYSTDGRLLATGFYDGSVKLWNVAGPALLRTMKGGKEQVETVTFSPDGQILAAGAENGLIYLWKTSDGSLLGILAGHTGAIRTLIFSLDGKLLTSSSDDGTVRLWGTQD